MMDIGNQIRIRKDHETGAFQLEALDHEGQPIAQYVPDLMSSPDDLTYTINDPEVLEQLISKFSVDNVFGKTVATSTFASIRKLNLQLGSRGQGAEGLEQSENEDTAISSWIKVIEHMPAKHRVKEVQVDMTGLDVNDDEAKDITDSISRLLSGTAGRKVNVFSIK